MFRPMFDDDPFFRDPFADMHRMMGMPSMQHRGNLQAQQPSMGQRNQQVGLQTNPMALSPFGMFGGSMFGGSLFGGMQSMMRDMDNSMRMMQSQQGMPGSSFQSSYTSISYGGGSGQPKVYQASSSTKVGPNGIKETQKTERNSATGLHKMAIGHHIDDRSHTIEKSHNTQTGDKEESQEFVNLDEDQAEEFDKEWTEKIRTAPMHHRSVGYRPVDRHSPYRYHRRDPAAIEYHQPSSSRSNRHARRRDYP